MAGSHQISALETTTGEVSPFAGTGREGLQDGPRGEAWFAQSSGLALDGGHLYVADSEVSAVRDIDLSTGMVSALVGEGLFVFGDQDGRGDAVRLQHPLGIAAHAGALFLADSYNHKIKRLDPAERRVQTWAGSGTAGCADGQGSAASFREPGGLSAHERGLFVADTNNHRVALIDWRSASVRTVIGA
jgi:DNA-binding beta-propeller fold protein YncE